VGQAMGKTGSVVSVDSGGDVKVKFDGGSTWIFNAQCCLLVSQGGGAGRVSSARPSLAVNTQSSSDSDDDHDNSQSVAYRVAQKWHHLFYALTSAK